MRYGLFGVGVASLIVAVPPSLVCQNPTATLSTVSTVAATAGGASVVGQMSLTSAAPAAGLVVALSSNAATAASVPPTVTVAAGATSATFPITTTPVAQSVTVTVTATLAGVVRTAVLTVQAPTLSRLLIPKLDGVASTTGEVDLTGVAPAGGMVAVLTSTFPNNPRIPSTVAIAPGSDRGTFDVTVFPVNQPGSVTVSASAGGVTKTLTLTLDPPRLISLGLNGYDGTATLNGPAASPFDIAVSSSSDAVHVPRVTVQQGRTSVQFLLEPLAVAERTSATITATLGPVVKTTTVIVPAASVARFIFGPVTTVGSPLSAGTMVTGVDSVVSGQSVSGSVFLSTAAGPSGFVVQLAANDVARVPPSVTIPAGETRGTFTVGTRQVSVPTLMTVTVTIGKVAKQFSVRLAAHP